MEDLDEKRGRSVGDFRMVPEVTFRRDVNAELRHSGYLVEPAEICVRRGKGIEASHLRRLSSVLRRQRATDASHILRLAANDRQHAAQKEQIADLHRLDVGVKGRGRRG
jgi:hypothetical protein